MATLLIRLPHDLLHEVDVCAKEIHISRATYVRKALGQMNAVARAQRRQTRLIEVSLRVRSENMWVNAELDAIEDAPNV